MCVRPEAMGTCGPACGGGAVENPAASYASGLGFKPGRGYGYAVLMTVSDIRFRLVCSMSRTTRLFQLMQALRSGPSPRTSVQLAQDLGVSVRTIYRDMDRLRASGLPIVAVPHKGFSLENAVMLPALAVSLEELEALHLVLLVNIQ